MSEILVKSSSTLLEDEFQVLLDLERGRDRGLFDSFKSHGLHRSGLADLTKKSEELLNLSHFVRNLAIAHGVGLPCTVQYNTSGKHMASSLKTSKEALIFLGLEAFNKLGEDLKEIYKVYGGFAIHEGEHLISSNAFFKYLREKEKVMKEAITTLRQCTREDSKESCRKKLNEVMAEKTFYNILEDVRIERLALKRSPGYDEYILASREFVFKDGMEQVKELWNSSKITDRDRFLFIVTTTLRYPVILTDELKEWKILEWCPYEIISKLHNKLRNFSDVRKLGDDLVKIYLALSEMDEEKKESKKEESKDGEPEKSESGEPDEGSESSSAGGSGDGTAGSAGDTSESEAETGKSEDGESEDESEEGEDVEEEDVEEEDEEKSESGDGDGEGGDGDGEGGDGDGESGEEDIEESIKNQIESDLESLIKEQELFKEIEDASKKRKRVSEGSIPFNELTDQIKDAEEKLADLNESEGMTLQKLKKMLDGYSGGDDKLDGELKEVFDSMVDEFYTSETVENDSLLSGRKIAVKRPKMSERNKVLFDDIVKLVKPFVQSASGIFRLRLAEDYYKSTDKVHGKLFQRRLAHATVSDRLFYKEHRQEAVGISLCLLLDESGSMGGHNESYIHRCVEEGKWPTRVSGATQALMMATMVYLALKKVPRVDLHVYSHGSFGPSENCMIKHLSGGDRPDVGLATYRYNIGYQNYDHLALRKVGDLFSNAAKYQKKVFIYIADGVPEGDSYWGASANKATKEEGIRLERLGMSVIAIGVNGHNPENLFKHSFAFTGDMRELIKNLRKVIISQVLGAGMREV